MRHQLQLRGMPSPVWWPQGPERSRLGDESMAQLLEESGSYRVLLKTSQRSRVRIFAEHSRFDMKNHLKLGDIAGRMATDARNRGGLKSTRSNVPRSSLSEIGDQWEEATHP